MFKKLVTWKIVEDPKLMWHNMRKLKKNVKNFGFIVYIDELNGNSNMILLVVDIVFVGVEEVKMDCAANSWIHLNSIV